MSAMRIFAGYDARESAGFHVFVQSLLATSRGYSLVPMTGEQRDGTNTFTYERFRVPERCTWSEWALFVDGSDMLLRADIAGLWALRDAQYAVQVVKHDYTPKHARKYIGTEMECANDAYPRKNWSSVMLINCGHMAHFQGRERMRGFDGKYLHRLSWLKDSEIGDLPVEWNWLDEYGENSAAKIVHYTNGIPSFEHYRNAPHAEEWRGRQSATQQHVLSVELNRARRAELRGSSAFELDERSWLLSSRCVAPGENDGEDQAEPHGAVACAYQAPVVNRARG